MRYRLGDAEFLHEGEAFGPCCFWGIEIEPGAPVDVKLGTPGRLNWKVVSVRPGGGRLDAVFAAEGLELRSEWALLGPALLSRKDVLICHGSASCLVRRCHPVLYLAPRSYIARWQSSAWCLENQPQTAPCAGADLVLRHPPGRTSDQASPYLVLDGGGAKLSVHVVPDGNWMMRAHPEPNGGGLPRVLVAAGHEEEGFGVMLKPGESLALPEVLYGDDDPAALHRAWQARSPGQALPVIYNTWFRDFDRLPPEELRPQLAAAKVIGAEVFVVDAGWFGDGEGWWNQVGNWQEQTDRAFRGNLKGFADEVRAAGLGFGLWMEPERFGPQAKIRKAQPEWFPHGEDPFTRIDLAQPAASAWLKGEMARLVKTYGLAWMKVDYNFPLGEDDSGEELRGYFRGWKRLIGELRREFPDTVFEACSSGAMRLDLGVVEQFPVGFLSDTVNPWDMLSIATGAWRRLPPGRLGRWAVVRERGGEVQAASGAGWGSPESTSVEFLAAVAFPGSMGFSGDLASLSAARIAELGRLVREYKLARPRIAKSCGYLLSPQMELGNREGWCATQLQDGDWNLVSAYRLNRGEEVVRLKLCNLQPSQSYQARAILGGATNETMTGHDLMSMGLRVTLPGANTAALLELREVR